MENSTIHNFLNRYICSLKERTRFEKKTVQYGFDWIIYQLGISKDWIPARLPFKRQINKITTKSEAEFGIDVAFLSSNNKILYIFVLKDEELNNRNWFKAGINEDLSKAITPDLKKSDRETIEQVIVILAYNKDEDANGIELFERFAKSNRKKIYRKIPLSFERWNLTKIVQEVKLNILSASLFPQNLFSMFEYICYQISDLEFGTEEWLNQLLPNWKQFINITLIDPIDERKILLIPVALIILNKYSKDTPSSYPGWIELIEWAMLKIWQIYQIMPDEDKYKNIRSNIIKIWMEFYIFELEKYFISNKDAFISIHGFTTLSNQGMSINSINDAIIVFWNITRLGLLSLAPQEFKISANNDQDTEIISKVTNRGMQLIIECILNNPASLRPLIDLHHIPIFLTWLMLWQAGKDKEIVEWLNQLESYLLIRRSGRIETLPFIESNSRLDLVAEHAATSKRPYNFSDSSSYLLLMILELCFSLNEKDRDQLLERYMRRIVKGIGDDGKSFVDNKIIDLIGWKQPEDWATRILKEAVVDGSAIITNNFEANQEETSTLAERIKSFVESTEAKYANKIPTNIPSSVYILACVKHNSPLPPSFWRNTIFNKEQGK